MTEEKNNLKGKFEATQKHLSDMRRIVFKDYEKINPENKNELQFKIIYFPRKILAKLFVFM